MVRQGVHHHGEGQQVTPSGEKEEQQLPKFQEVPPNWTKQDVASVCHAMDKRVSLSELTDYIAGICREQTQANNKDDRSI